MPPPPGDPPVLSHPPYTIRLAGAGDGPGIVETFNLVFAEGNPWFVPRTLPEWNWEFVENPAGRQAWIAVHEDGTVAAHFAGLPLRAVADGAPATLAHIVDSYTHPAHRSGLKRPGLFVRTALAYVDWFMWPDRNLVNFGFPVPAAWRIGAGQVGYVFVRTQNYLALPAARELPRPTAAAETLGAGDPLGPEVERLFRRCARGGDVMAARDAAFYEWRVRRHPRLAYRIGVVRDGGELRGLAVYRDGAYTDTPQGLLVDWLVPDADRDAGRALLGWARELAREGGQNQAGIVLADTDPWWLPLQELGLRARGTKYVLVHGDVGRPAAPSGERLRACWRYTLLDTDLA